MTSMMSTSASEGRGIFYNDGAVNKSLVTPYPACSMSWGSQQVRVRLLDLGAMAYYAYVRKEDKFKQFLSESFDTEDKKTEIVHFDEFDDLPRIVASRTCQTNAEPCTLIMAVKGTSTRLEVMTDIGIFSTVSVMQMLDMIAPLLGTV